MLVTEQATDQPARADAEQRRFGRHVRSCRRARGLTQEELAERSDLSGDTIRRLEKGSFSPSLDTLRKLCMGLQFELSTLFDSFELGEREASRELGDALEMMTPAVREALFQLVAAIQRMRGEN